MPPEFADVQVTLLLPEYIAALGEGDDSVGLIQLAKAAMVCKSWNDSCAA